MSKEAGLPEISNFKKDEIEDFLENMYGKRPPRHPRTLRNASYRL
jgi:hypothetical protein